MPRLTSEFWVQAFLRGQDMQGRNGAIVYKGSTEAGAVYVVINHLDRTHTLLEPAPGSAFDDEGQRRFVISHARKDWPDIASRIERVRKSDSDVWLIEVDDRDGLAGLKIATT